MTIGLVGQDQITTFTSPVNGTAPIDANQVKGNDNTIKTQFNLHDADATIHFQSSTNAARPAAGTAGRKWLDTDTYRVYYDDGSSWHEIAYFASSGGTVSGNLLITGTLGVTGATTLTTLLAGGTISGTSGILAVRETAGNGYGLTVQNRNALNRWGIAVDQSIVDDGIFTIDDLTSGIASRLRIGTSGIVTIAQGLVVAAGGATVTGNSTITGTLGVTSTLTMGAGSAVAWTGRSQLVSPADGTVGVYAADGITPSNIIVGILTATADAVMASVSGKVIIGNQNGSNASAGNVCIGNASAPIGNPTAGGFLWVESGALKFRGSSGTVTTLAAA